MKYLREYGADNTNNLIDYFGYTDGKRISTSDGSYRDVSGYTTIEYIDLSEFVNNETVAFHIKGVSLFINQAHGMISLMLFIIQVNHGPLETIRLQKHMETLLLRSHRQVIQT